MEELPHPTSLLDLPDKALLAVLRCLAADNRWSLISAASAHSTLHQLSAAALSSISLEASQQQYASLQLYLARHGQHVSSLQLGSANDLWHASCHQHFQAELPPRLQLQRLSLQFIRLQLLDGGGRAGVLQAGATIKQLELEHCDVCDYSPDAALAQALSQLPQLEHLKFASWHDTLPFPGGVLSHLQQLTSLDVIDRGDVLEFVHLVPGLLDLTAQLTLTDSSTTKLSHFQQPTSLVLSFPHCALLHPAGLENKSQLQHLEIRVRVAGGPAGVSALLSQLQQMTQLTHLSLNKCWDIQAGPGVPYDLGGPPAAAYAALTASSSLQHLHLFDIAMPQDIWQHVLPADRQLPQLRVLETAYCGVLAHWMHADTARLASCCPNLQELSLCTHEPAHALQPLCSMAALTALSAHSLDDAGLTAIAELTQLRELFVEQQQSATDVGLLQLTQLRQLTLLRVERRGTDGFRFLNEVANPVWRQLLDCCLRSEQPGMAQLAQQAAASLEQVAP